MKGCPARSSRVSLHDPREELFVYISRKDTLVNFSFKLFYLHYRSFQKKLEKIPTACFPALVAECPFSLALTPVARFSWLASFHVFTSRSRQFIALFAVLTTL